MDIRLLNRVHCFGPRCEIAYFVILMVGSNDVHLKSTGTVRPVCLGE